MVRPSTRTARVASLNRAPWQVGQPTAMSGRYWTSRSIWPSPRQVGHCPSRVLNEKCPGFQRRRPGVGGVGENAADLVERPAVGRGRRPRVLADRRGVDLDDLADAGEIQAADVPGQRRPAQQRPCGRDEAVQDECGLPGAGRPGQRGQPADREGGGDVVQVVQVADVQDDLPVRTGPRRTVTSTQPWRRPGTAR